MEVIGYPKYLIYPDGKVQNKKTKRYLLGTVHNCGYREISLVNDNGKGRFLLHRLLALHYIPNPDNKPFIDHINRDRKDNRLENLRWVTALENGQNQSLYLNNTSGIKNIRYREDKKRYIYEKRINYRTHRKHFKTLEEAIAYKKDYENALD